jgi:hypothetical protein
MDIMWAGFVTTLSFVESYGWRLLIGSAALFSLARRVAAELDARDRRRLAAAAVDPARVAGFSTQRSHAVESFARSNAAMIAAKQVKEAKETREERERAEEAALKGGIRLGR